MFCVPTLLTLCEKEWYRLRLSPSLLCVIKCLIKAIFLIYCILGCNRVEKQTEGKRLIFLIARVVTPATLALSDADTFLTDSNITDNEITTGQVEVSNSLANATITITMCVALHE